MLALRPFRYLKPRNLDELKEALTKADERTKILAGGTDLLPNLKHGLYDIDQIISLRNVKELNGISIEKIDNNDEFTINALVKLRELNSVTIASCLPALAEASRQIASPQIRNMGTVGGNICLDTRCLYINQSAFWRSSLGYCLKKDGHCCHVIKTGKRCVAAQSNDLATVLLALDARLNIIDVKEGNKTMMLDDFYTANGEKNNDLSPQQLVASVSFNYGAKVNAGFFKLRFRNSIDFPLLSAATAFELDEDEQQLLGGKVVVNALVAKAKVLSFESFKGQRYDRKLIADIAQWVQQKCHPQTNIAGSTAYRKEMISTAISRALLNARATKD